MRIEEGTTTMHRQLIGLAQSSGMAALDYRGTQLRVCRKESAF